MILFLFLKMKNPLKDAEKAEIFTLVERHGKQWTKISQEMGRSKETKKSFYNRFQKTQTFSNQLGRPSIIIEELENGIAGKYSR